MNNYTIHTIRLQDGKLFNFKKGILRNRYSLYATLKHVSDGRCKRGIRHPLPSILLILFGGISAGFTTVQDCQLWALNNKEWLKKVGSFAHGIPDPTTLSRTIQKLAIDSLIETFLAWQETLYGKHVSAASFDGKTMRGVHGKEVIRHILSLIAHGTHQILGQIGVDAKENEIPAFRRLLTKIDVSGLLLIGDALHTQTKTISDILGKEADYLLSAKDNQEGLVDDLRMFFEELPWGSDLDGVCQKQDKGNRNIITTVWVSHDKQMSNYLGGKWKNVATLGKIERHGIRMSTDGKETKIDEIVYCIASRELTAQEVLTHTRNHWQIENNLHWEKDWVFTEDRQRLRCGAAPQVMTFLRSMALSLFGLFCLSSPAVTVSNFKMNPTLHRILLF